ncbi:hypothetical protein, partial [Clostridium sp. DSM 8431]|uniref:hypothetical protein n=1 Tax=Clostridium sp. DSM 8431 TaxID=1761781 RepID=UPI001A9A3989
KDKDIILLLFIISQNKVVICFIRNLLSIIYILSKPLNNSNNKVADATLFSAGGSFVSLKKVLKVK